MKFVKPSYNILTKIDGAEVLKELEQIARTCYKSEDKVREGSSEKLVSSLIKRGHEAMLEFFDITVRFVVDRGVSHELVRHRLASYAQESTRYCNYSKDKFGSELTFIQPCFWDKCQEHEEDCEKHAELEETLLEIEKCYFKLIELGASPQEARYILPNGLKTEINVKMNIRSWRNFLTLRTANAAHPQMREIARPLLEELKQRMPIVFEDINYK